VLFNYLQEGSWSFAVQLLTGEQLVSCSSAAPQEGSLSCAVHLFHGKAADLRCAVQIYNEDFRQIWFLYVAALRHIA
jgi:hypothetical protein